MSDHSRDVKQYLFSKWYFELAISGKNMESNTLITVQFDKVCMHIKFRTRANTFYLIIQNDHCQIDKLLTSLCKASC